MINKIWALFIFFGIVLGFALGEQDKTLDSIFMSGENAVKTVLQILPGMCFFCGLLRIAEKSGILSRLSSIFGNAISKLFSDIPPGHASIPLMAMNILSNIFGMGNAATAFGLNAMNELGSLNKLKDRASDAMCMFIILNTCTPVLFPTSIISLRFAYGSKDPTGVIPLIFIVSCGVCLSGILACKVLKRFWKNF